MTIQELSSAIKSIVLDDVGMRTYYIGNTWDMSAGKEDKYPAFWFELPVLVDYNIPGKQFKIYTFSVDVLKMPEMDNTSDELEKISECEVLADKFLIYLQATDGISLSNNPTAISVKSINADNACGVRLDIQVKVQRECLT